METIVKFDDILDKFLIEGTIVSVEPYGFGHINRTYLAVYNENGKQKVGDVCAERDQRALPDVALLRTVLNGYLVFITDFPRHGIKQKQVKQNCQCTGHVSECSVLGIPCCQSQRKTKHRRSELMQKHFYHIVRICFEKILHSSTSRH